MPWRDSQNSRARKVLECLERMITIRPQSGVLATRTRARLECFHISRPSAHTSQAKMLPKCVREQFPPVLSRLKPFLGCPTELCESRQGIGERPVQAGAWERFPPGLSRFRPPLLPDLSPEGGSQPFSSVRNTSPPSSAVTEGRRRGSGVGGGLVGWAGRAGWWHGGGLVGWAGRAGWWHG